MLLLLISRFRGLWCESRWLPMPAYIHLVPVSGGAWKTITRWLPPGSGNTASLRGPQGAEPVGDWRRHAGSCVAEPTAGNQGSPFSHPATPGAGSKHSPRPPGSTGWDQASHPPVPQCQGRLNPAPGSTGRRGPGPYNLLKEKWCHLPFQAPYLAEGQGQAAGGVVPSFSPQERQVGGTTVPSGFRASTGSKGKAVEL